MTQKSSGREETGRTEVPADQADLAQYGLETESISDSRM